ncbi:MAG: SpoIIE family protein phosphatase [Leptospirales bacterium]|nr:SpoIIE family protein phosphatase [Leptospirales bacterium]
MSVENQNSDLEMEEELFRLRALVDSFALLNASLDLDVVLKNTLRRACELMRAEVGSIALINEERTDLIFLESTDPQWDKLKQISVPIGQGIAGSVAKTGKTVRVDDVHNDPRFYEQIDRKLGHKTQTYICTPLIVESIIIGTAQLMNRMDGQAFTEGDEELLEGFAHQAALAIQNAHLHQVKLRQKSIDAEMSLCSEIQNKLFPAAMPSFAGYEVLGGSKPAREVGGDYYGFRPARSGALDCIIADVSGKGISAAMLVSEFHTGYQLLNEVEPTLTGLANRLNKHLLESLVTGRFITCFVARIQPQSGEVEYLLAGHTPPVILRHDGGMEELERTGPVLGLTAFEFSTGRCQLGPGDLLASYSDGYSDVHNGGGELYGEDRINALLRQWRDLPLPDVIPRLDATLDVFREEQAFPDDRTLLLIRRKP